MWPPIEMFGTVKVITRFSTIQIPSPLSIRLRPRLRAKTAAAAISPKIAPGGADGEAVGLEQKRSERAAQERHEVDQREAQAPDRRLE